MTNYEMDEQMLYFREQLILLKNKVKAQEETAFDKGYVFGLDKALELTEKLYD